MAVHSVQHVSFHFSVCIVKSSMWIYISMCLLLWNSCYNTSVTGQYQVIGSSQTVLAKVGEDVILPCHIEPYVNMTKKTVEWTRPDPDLKPPYVYLFQDGRYVDSVQNPLYKKRTSLFPQELPHGNISMKLTRVQLSDEGKYKCFAPHLRSSRLIQLLVGAVSQPVITSNGRKDDGLSLTCDSGPTSGCWYPQPEMSWLDRDRNNINAEPSVTEKSSNHCYVVQRTVTVRRAGRVTCRVHLPHINHTAERSHGIEEVKEPRVEKKGPTAGVIAGIVITVMIIIIIIVAAILGYLYWKKKKRTRRDAVKYQGVKEEQRKPRTWTQISERWSPQLEKLANIDDCKVTKVGSLVFGKDEEFCITVGSEGPQVFLGLNYDGTEVAVKRMSKLNYNKLKNEKYFLRQSKPEYDSIVRYVDSAEDENFGYIALQLCEYNLEEYITKHNLSELERKLLAYQFLRSLSVLHGQNPTIIHQNIKPQNVLIDIQSKARLADFGIITEYVFQTTQSRVAGKHCWTATEILKKIEDGGDISYERSSDIQVSGMLIYYILSGGHHPFGKGTRCGTNILDREYNLDLVQDVAAVALIKGMINEDPEGRPTVEECVAHRYFCEKSAEDADAAEDRIDLLPVA